MRHGALRLRLALGPLLAARQVPLGAPANEAGLLLIERGHLILRRDDGGRWRLDASRRIHRLLGQRVKVQASRSGFDLLDVHAFGPERSQTLEKDSYSLPVALGVALIGLQAVVAVLALASEFLGG